MVPSAAGTMLAPTAALDMCVVERLLLFERTGDWAARPGALYASRGFPSDHFLAASQPFEWLSFNQHLPYKSTRTCLFTTSRDGWFDGLHMHLVVDVDEANRIDTHRERTTWTCTYVRLLDTQDAVWLPSGSLIECVCNVDASTDSPAYSVKVSASCAGDTGPLRHVADFAWRGDG